MKKVLSSLIVLAMVASLAACAGDTPAPASSTEPASDPATVAATEPAPAPAEETSEKVELTYSLWGGEAEQASTQATVDQFNASQDRINVSLLVFPWETYVETMNTRAMANDLPDTAILQEASIISWADQGMLYDVSEMYGADEAKPLDSTVYKYQGKPVAYSVANNSLFMYYNKDMFDAAGVAYPPTNADSAWTWDEFVNVAKQLTLDANGLTPNDAGFDKSSITQYGAMIENLTWQLEVWCRSNGGGFYSADGSTVTIGEPASIEAIQRVADLHLVDNVAPLSSGLTDDGVQRSLVAGTTAMTTNGAWNIGTALSAARDEGLNYGVAVLPFMQEKITMNTGGANVVFNQTEYPAESMEWLKWYGREENSWDGLIATGIWMPVLESYYTDEALTRKWLENPAYPPYDDAKSVLVDYPRQYGQPVSWYYTNNTDAFNTLLGSTLGDVWTGAATAQDAITNNLTALEAAHQGL